MKKFLLFLSFLLFPAAVKAQEIYHLVMESVNRTLRDSSSGFTMTRVAQFKKTALVYLKDKTLRTMPEMSEELLNTQAYYLSEFTTLYIKVILNSKRTGSERQQNRIKLFMDASKSNPLFNDTDASVVDVYVQGGNEITPFSLDTDWEKAFREVKMHF